MNGPVVVAGAGSIGCFVGGLLAAAGREVRFLARPRMVSELRSHGLTLTDLEGGNRRVLAQSLSATDDHAVLAEAAWILVTVKSSATVEMAKSISRHAKAGAGVVSLQNGIGNADRLRAIAREQRVVAGMVPFNVVHQGDGRFHRGTDGSLTVEAGVPGLRSLLSVPGLAVAEHPDMTGLAWGKLLLNLNNALNALSGLPLRQQLSDRRWRLVLAACQREALETLAAAKIVPARVGKVRPWLLPRIVALPDLWFHLIAGTMVKIDPEARSSMWEDLEKRRPTEVDHLQGAVVELARSLGRDAPMNRKVMEQLKHAEAIGMGSPRVTAESLRTALPVEARQAEQGSQHFLQSCRAFSAGEVIAPFQAAATYDRPARMTLQVSEQEHITLSPSVLAFTNHSCDPNAFFDVEQRALVALKPIAAGEPVTFFYPSTEWIMAEPFTCACGSPRCLQQIQGASQMPERALEGQRLTPHITRLLQQAGRQR